MYIHYEFISAQVESLVSLVAQKSKFAKWAESLLSWLHDDADQEGFSNALLLAMVTEFVQVGSSYVHAAEGHLKNGVSDAVEALPDGSAFSARARSFIPRRSAPGFNLPQATPSPSEIYNRCSHMLLCVS